MIIRKLKMKNFIENFILISFYGIMSVTGSTILDTMLEPICQAKCLKSYKDSIRESDNSHNVLKNPFLIHSYCLNNPYCKGCMIGCSNAAQTAENCQKNCKNHAKKFQQSCLFGCNFVRKTKLNKPGVCPKVTQKSQCSNECKDDSVCFKQGTKCCKSLYCSFSCQMSEYPKFGVPPIPSAPTVRQISFDKNPDSIQFDLDWKTYNISNIDDPVLFVVQFRIDDLDSKLNENINKWRNLVITSKSGAIISGIEPEPSYQFRLLAFSENGIKGVGEMTLPIVVDYQPKNPNSPKHISEKVTRINNGKISVTLTWQPGDSNSLLQLSNYHISWKRVYELNENNPLVTVYDVPIPATETQYTIENLIPSASYVVKIVSVVTFRNITYSSVPNIYYISTTSVPQQKPTEDRLIYLKEDNSECACGYSNKHFPFVIKNATMINDQLAIKIKMKDGIEFHNGYAPYSFQIRWRPTACIESQFKSATSSEFEDWQTIVVKDHIENYLTNLQFHCNYQMQIELMALSTKKIIKFWEGCFCTPSCSKYFTSIGHIQPPCTNADLYNPPIIYQLKVAVKKSVNDYKMDAELYWVSEQRASMTAFRITWGPIIEEPIDETLYGKDFMPLLDAGKALSKVVHYSVHKSVLKDLHSEKIYLVKLQAIDEYSVSEEISIFFKSHFEKNSKSNTRLLTFFMISLASVVCFYHI